VEVAALDRGRDHLRAMLRDAIASVRADGGGHLTFWAHAADADDDALARDAGLDHERDLLQMRVRLPLAQPVVWPGGVDVRAFRVGVDERVWLDVNNRAFAGHPEQGGWTIDNIVRREAEPWFDPEGFILAFDADGLAGFCWTKVHAAEPPREPDALGEIYVIGADPRWHGRGLGRALTAAGLESLADRGVGVGILYVDGANAAAVGLYRALGFSVHRTDRAYGTTVAPGTAP
jgi:mycothiol synthase